MLELPGIRANKQSDNNLHKQKSDTECYKINHQNLSIFLVSPNMGDPQTPQKLFISIPKLMDLGAPNS